MRNFIILTGVTGRDISIDIDDITSIVGNWGQTTVYFDNDGNGWNVKESVQEIVKRINEINNNNKKQNYGRR